MEAFTQFSSLLERLAKFNQGVQKEETGTKDQQLEAHEGDRGVLTLWLLREARPAISLRKALANV